MSEFNQYPFKLFSPGCNTLHGQNGRRHYRILRPDETPSNSLEYYLNNKKELVIVSLRKEFGTNIISITIDDPVTFSSDIDEIASINQEILDIVNDDIPDGYYLEVTTPGVERELKENEYEKSIGKYICIKTYQKLETAYNLKEIYGTLISVDQDN